MEHTSQALMTSGRKKPEESTPSCSGKKARTGEQHGSPWELLPTEMVVSIFKQLPNQDLLPCRSACKRFAMIVDEVFLLDRAKAFCKLFYQPPDPVLFGRDRYKQVLRPWLEAFLAAQQRLIAGASDDLQFSDSKRKETERQASSEQNEQVQAIQLSPLELLDRWTGNSEFSKALFFIHAKTLQNAESLYLQEKFSHFFSSEYIRQSVFSPDGRSLLICFGNTIRFMVLDENSNMIRQYNKSYDTPYNIPVARLRFSPDSHSLLIGLQRSVIIMGFDGEEWVHKNEIRWNDHRGAVCFSPDSGSLTAVFDDSIRIMGRDEEGNWVQNSEIHIRKVRMLCFSPNGSALAISSDDHAVWTMGRDEKGNWDQTSYQDRNSPGYSFSVVESVCFSPDSGSLAISGRDEISTYDGIIKSVLIMRSNEKGNWVINFTIPCSDFCSACFSPDGGSLAIPNSYDNNNAILIMRPDERGNWVQNFVIPCDPDLRCITSSFSPDSRNLMFHLSPSTMFSIIGLGGPNSRVYKYKPFRMNHQACCDFSPDGGCLAIGRGSTTWVMGLDKGKWVNKVCISSVSNNWSVSPSPWEDLPSGNIIGRRRGLVVEVCFSPDSLRLAITSEYGDAVSSESTNAQVSVYEIKTGAKVITDRDNQFLKGFFPP